MVRSRVVTGFYGAENGKSIEGRIRLDFLSSGLSETLSVEYIGICRFDLPYRPLERFVAGARAELRGQNKSREKSIIITGQFTGGNTKLNRGAVRVWYRSGDPVETLSLEFKGAGQITLPLAPVLNLVAAERAGRA